MTLITDFKEIYVTLFFRKINLKINHTSSISSVIYIQKLFKLTDVFLKNLKFYNWGTWVLIGLHCQSSQPLESYQMVKMKV